MEELPKLSTLQDPINPDGEEGWELLHERTYSVRSYHVNDHLLVLRGAVADDKPPHLYLADDPDGMRLHHMTVDLYVERPSMDIVDVKVKILSYPNPNCPAVEDAYKKLIGLNIGRGFSKAVRELFGGPNGCSHTTALLIAMAPVNVQSIFSARYRDMRHAEKNGQAMPVGTVRQNLAVLNVNTCHVWAEGGEVVERAREGNLVAAPLPVLLRCKALGLDPDTWVKQVTE